MKQLLNNYAGSRRSHHRRQRSQQGMAAIIVTLVTMLVISLIVLGFANVSRVEQRTSLDQQLSTQAFYAAESGVDDVRAILKQNLATGVPLVNKDDCTDNNPGGNYPRPPITLKDGSDVSYTCLKVNVSPENAQFSGVGENYIVAPINTAQPITSIELTWTPSTAPPNTSSPAECPSGINGVFTPNSDWGCKYGLLRTDLVSTAGAITQASLQNSAMTGFFVPNRASAAGTVAYAGNLGRPNIVAANCDTAAYGRCRAVITDLGGSQYALRISSIYQNSDVKVVAFAGTTPLPVSGAQAIIDVTGKAQDVLRRIQVRVPLTLGSSGSGPAYAIQSNDAICKRFRVSTTYFSIPGDIQNNDDKNPMCVQKSDGIPPANP